MTWNTFYYQNPYLNFSNPYAAYDPRPLQRPPARHHYTAYPRPPQRPPTGPHYTASPRPLQRPPAGPFPLSRRPDYEKLLGEGLNVSEETINAVREFMPKILRREQDGADQIEWYPATQNYVFSLRGTPHIFKIASNPQGDPPGANNELTKKQFDNMVAAKEAREEEGLTLLELPKAKKFQVDGTLVIAQERVKIPSDQCRSYQHQGLESALGHLTTLIAMTGLSHIQLENIPGKRAPVPTPLRIHYIILLNLDKMEGAGIGICGLIGCLPLKRQVKAVFRKATLEGIVCTNPTLQEARDRRLQELDDALKIEEEIQLNSFHKQNGIIDNERKLLEIKSWEQLGLPLSETSLFIEKIEHNIIKENRSAIRIVKQVHKSITLQEMVEKVILAINKAIEGSPDNLPLKFKRQVRIVPPLEDSRLGSEDKQKQWTTDILYALMHTGYIFSTKKDADGFVVQA